MNEQPTVFVVDDDDAVRDSLALLLLSTGFAVRTFANASAFLQAFSEEMIGCLVLDMKMPGMSGAELHAELSRRGSQLPVLFLTAHGNIPTSVRAIQRGAVDFLVKPPDAQALVARVRRTIGETAARQALWTRLTERERRVLAHLAAGQSSKTIASALDISARTVEGHRTHLMRKLGARNALQLASISREFDLSAFAPQPGSAGSHGDWTARHT